MMHSSTRNNGPLDLTTTINCSSSRRRLSLTISMEDGSCHDLTNLSLKANMPQKDLFPSAQVVRRLPDIDDSHTLQLWTPLPRSNLPLHRSNTTTTCTLKADERVTPRRRSSQQRAPPRRPTTCADETSAPLSPPRCGDSLSSSSTHNTPSPRPPCMSQSDRAYSAPPPPRPTPPTPPAPATIPSARPGEPGPRPKVNYKKLYGAGAGSGSKKDLRSSQRHISFQEQQLQRTLEEEERLRREKEEGTAPPQQQQQEEEQPEEPSPRPPASPRRRSPSPPSPRPPQHEEQPVPPLVSMTTNHTAPPKRNDEEKPRPAPAPYQAPPRPRSPPGGSSQTVMEIAPNLFVPYKGSHETWEAVQRGQFTVTTCFACTLQLVVIDTAEFLVCPDCHTVSPLSYSGDSRVERCGVGLGIKREWCDTEAALPTDMQQQGQQQQSSAVFAPLAMQPYPTTNNTTSTRPSRSSYEQRHQEKQAKYNERSASPEHDDRTITPAQRRATFLI